MNRPNLSDWEVEVLRVTVFTPDLIQPAHYEEWWGKATDGAEPENLMRKPALGTFSVSGPLDDAILTLGISPGRIDWVLSPKVADPPTASVLGQYADQDDQLVDRLSTWLQFPTVTVTRLAFGEVLRLPVPNRIVGYKTAATLLPDVRLDPERSRDFQYQINRPRESKAVSGLAINRLSKWAVMQLLVGDIGMRVSHSTSNFVRLELDMSTDRDSQRDVSKDPGLLPIFRELTLLAREIASAGDQQ